MARHSKRQAVHISSEFLAPHLREDTAESEPQTLSHSPQRSQSQPAPHLQFQPPQSHPQLQQIAKISPRDGPTTERIEGWLMKWTTVMKGGWKKRFFVLSGASGSLVYFLDSRKTKQRGAISLINSKISVNKKDDTAFVIEHPGAKPCWLRTERPEDRDKWIPALVQVAKAMADSSSTDLLISTNTTMTMPSDIFTKATANVQECSDPVTDLQALIATAEAEKAELERELVLIKQFKETKKSNQDTEVTGLITRASVLTHLVTAILQSLEPIIDVVSAIQEKNKFLQTTVYGLEKEREEVIEKMKQVQEGAMLKGDRKHAQIVKTLSRSLELTSPYNSDEDEDDDDSLLDLSSDSDQDEPQYFDAIDDFSEDLAQPTTTITVPKIFINTPSPAHKRAASEAGPVHQTNILSEETIAPHHLPGIAISTPVISGELAVIHGIEPPPLTTTFSTAPNRQRFRLPANKSNEKISIWSLVKEAVGKDISRVTLPVILCEPISFLQRSAEDFEYSELIDTAISKADPFLRMVYVACFAISGYSSTERTGKPFNPLLGETFELIRTDKKFRMITEQVTHHPPACAIHTEGEGYLFWTDVVVKNKFWGKSLEVFPTGTLHLKLTKLGDYYKWHKVTTCVNNIMLGTPWIDNYGTMEIVNSTENIKCKIEFIKKGWFDSSGGAKVEGKVMDSKGTVRYEIKGKWNESLSATSASTGEKFEVWRKNPLPQLFVEQYQMTQFAIQMNDSYEEQLRVYLPQTDTRLRPDTRALENGDVELAGKEKGRLEEKQRATRKEMENRNQTWEPRWFKKEGEEWVYSGGYWKERDEKNFQNVPNIY